MTARALATASTALAIGAALAAVGLAWWSRHWPLVQDAALLHYVGWLVAHGAVPYRDVFDMNPPGTHALHWAVVALAGPGDAAWRAVDLGWLAATCALAYRLVRPLGTPATAGVAAALVALYHLAGGPLRAGQRDFLLGAPLLLGAGGVARYCEGAGRAALVVAGLGLGAAATIKPFAGLYALLCAAVALAAPTAPRAGSPPPGRPGARARAVPGRARSRAGALVALAAGTAAVPALLLGWLAAHGGLAAFADVFLGYVVPLYSRRFTGQGADWSLGALTLGGTAAMLALLLAARPPARARAALVAAGGLYGAAHYVLQRRGWAYHLAPAGCFLAVAAGAALGAWQRAGPGRWAAAGRTAALGVAVLAAAAAVAGGLRAADGAAARTRLARVAAMERALAPLLAPGDRVQVLDGAGGALHALLRLGVRQPTRFLYDSPSRTTRRTRGSARSAPSWSPGSRPDGRPRSWCASGRGAAATRGSTASRS
jgi:hypothetical protein